MFGKKKTGAAASEPVIPEKTIRAILERAQNPLTHKPVTADGALTSLRHDEGRWHVALAIRDDRRLQLAIEAQIRTALSKENLPADAVKLKFTGTAETPAAAASAPPQGAPHAHGIPNPGVPTPKPLPNVKHLVAVGSGKGGVGKSTVSINLAFSLAAKGHKVGLLDADIYGPSLGKMIGHAGKISLDVVDDKIVPFSFEGVKIMSFSFLIEEAQAVVWRGPMLAKAIEQFLFDIAWGELDFLIVDLPPGTGDVQLSLSQFVKMEGALIVTTPQNVALQDAGRAVTMFQQVNIPLLGVIENMSEFVCPHCGKPSLIFSRGGGSNLAGRFELPLLGKIPLTIALMDSGEQGIPLTSALLKSSDKNTGDVIAAFDHISENLLSLLQMRS